RGHRRLPRGDARGALPTRLERRRAGALPEARRGADRGLLPRRRPRARARVRLPCLLRRRPARLAGGRARDDSRLRRDAAPGQAGRSRSREGRDHAATADHGRGGARLGARVRGRARRRAGQRRGRDPRRPGRSLAARARRREARPQPRLRRAAPARARGRGLRLRDAPLDAGLPRGRRGVRREARPPLRRTLAYRGWRPSGGIAWLGLTASHVVLGAQSFVATMVRTVFAQPDAQTVHEQHRRIVDQLATRFPEAATLLEEAAPGLLAFTAFPKEHWRQLWSTDESVKDA